MKKVLTVQAKDPIKKGFDSLLKRYRITQAQIVDFAAKHPDVAFFTEEAVAKILLGIITMAIKLDKKIKEQKAKKCIVKKK